MAALEEKEAFATIRANARRTIVENYKFRAICLPNQLKLLEKLA